MPARIKIDPGSSRGYDLPGGGDVKPGECENDGSGNILLKDPVKKSISIY
jgi:hypothetical protein